MPARLTMARKTVSVILWRASLASYPLICHSVCSSFDSASDQKILSRHADLSSCPRKTGLSASQMFICSVLHSHDRRLPFKMLLWTSDGKVRISSSKTKLKIVLINRKNMRMENHQVTILDRAFSTVLRRLYLVICNIHLPPRCCADLEVN